MAIKIAGIVVGAIAGTTAAIVGIAALVQNKRMQERAQEAQRNLQAYQEKLVETQRDYALQDKEAQEADVKEFLAKWGVPLGVTAALFIV